jgi:hypothetical protein
MMSKVRRSAVLAGLLVLPILAAAGSAGAQGAFIAVHVGVGIDHTHMRTQRVRHGATPNRVGAAEAIDVLNRAAAQRQPARPPPQAPVATPVGGLRGLLAQRRLDTAGLLNSPGASDGPLPGARPGNRPTPYVRLGEGEQVFGFSFKIQPPSQAADPASPRP